jgi:hypothetical protein
VHRKEEHHSRFTDKDSDIHLLTKEQVWAQYAPQYDRTKCLSNLRYLMKQFEDKQGPFSDVSISSTDNAADNVAVNVEPWSTRKKVKSKAWTLLFCLFMDPKTGIHDMSPEEIHESDPLFLMYPLEDFKKYVKNMAALTEAKIQQLILDKRAYECHISRFPRNSLTIRGYPFWDTSCACKLLTEDWLNGNVQSIKPADLWKSREEYKEFPLHIFRAHIYQEKRKQLEGPYWQNKRNILMQKKHNKDVTKLNDKWQMSRLVKKWENTHLNLNEESD